MDTAVGSQGHSAADAKQDLLAQLRRILSHSLGSNLLPTRGQDGSSWKVDWPLTAVLLPGLMILSSTLYRLMEGEIDSYRRLYLKLIAIQAWGLVFVWGATWIAWNVKTSILKLVEDDLAPEISADSMARAARSLQKRPDRPWRWVLSATLLWCVLGGSAMAWDLGIFQGRARGISLLIFWIWWLSFALIYAMAIKLGFAATFYWDLVQGYRGADLDSYPLTPAEAPVIRLTLRIGSEPLGFMVITALYLMTLVFWIRDLPWFLVVNLAICLLSSIGLGAAVYWRAYTRLADLIRERRARTLREIEARLAQLYAAPPGESESKNFELLLNLHSQVVGRSPGLGALEILKLAGPLLPQLIALVTAIASLALGSDAKPE